MPPHLDELPREPNADPPAWDRAFRGRRVFVTVLPALAVTAVALMVVLPPRETLSRTSIARPDSKQIRMRLNATLDQIYRSFELDDEAATYDRIAQFVSGDTLRDIYLEVRRSMLNEEGGRVSIDRVNVGAVDRIEWQADGGCQLDATWTVRGTVGHFGHSHERQNRYRARISLKNQSGDWKMSSIEFSEYERER